MLRKLFNFRKLSLSSHVSQKPPAVSSQPEVSVPSLKIVHAGGHVEYYYMALPAVRILEKYPTLVLARPEIFRRPWDSVVRKDEILTPGEKIFLVPRRTVKKLRTRIRKPDITDCSVNSFTSNRDNNSISESEVSQESSSTSFKSGLRKKNGARKHVRFAGIHRMGQGITKSSDSARGSRVASAPWQPSLEVISENFDD